MSTEASQEKVTIQLHHKDNTRHITLVNGPDGDMASVISLVLATAILSVTDENAATALSVLQQRINTGGMEPGASYRVEHGAHTVQATFE